LFAGFLKGVETLEALLSEGRHLGIRVTASPPRKLFRTCLTTAHAPEVPLNFPVTLKRSNLQALLRLREDETHTISRDFAGHCKAGLGATSSCHYDLHMTVKIRRWVSRKRCGTRWCPNRFP
jgi:hypothetical protein